jgi:hypothetical protein
LDEVDIDSIWQQIESMRNYFDKYKNEGFASSLIVAKGIATKMGVEPSFPVKRQAVRKMQFDQMDYKEEILKQKRIWRLITFWLWLI